MFSKSSSWRLKIWIACFAMLMNTLAPSISHALAFARGNVPTWDICRTDDKVRAIPAKKQAASDAGTMEDCGYCLPHAGTYLLLPSALTGLAILGGHELRPFLFYHAPKPLLMLTAAPPRGPPAIS